MRKAFVVGLAYTPDRLHLAMIHKLKPAVQHGRLNGIGGKIEDGELPIRAMQREFMEEACQDIQGWDNFLHLEYPECTLYFYRAFHGRAALVKTGCPDEGEVRTLQLNGVLSGDYGPLMPNLRWIIPLSLEHIVNQPVFISCRL